MGGYLGTLLLSIVHEQIILQVELPTGALQVPDAEPEPALPSYWRHAAGPEAAGKVQLIELLLPGQADIPDLASSTSLSPSLYMHLVKQVMNESVG